MSAPVVVWVLRVAWISLPLTAGPLFADALDPREPTFRTGASLALWGLWALTLLAALVPHVLTLTAVRLVAPAAGAAAVWAAVTADTSTAAAVGGLVAAVAVGLLSLAPDVGDRFVDGSSYGDERRLALRAPAVLVLGPVPLTWAVAIAGAAAGPLLLLARQWVAGGIATVLGWAAAVVAVRSLHRLARRWLVLVPAGLVVHDHLALREPVLFPATSLVAVGPAPAGTDVTDLSLAAAGTPLRVALDRPAGVVTGPGFGRHAGEERTVTSFLVSPTRPGRAVQVAAARGLPIG
jgi:hypothetical protein